MSQNVTKIKKRISSVSGALKVTSAMKLVSTVKLKKWKGRMLYFRDYAQEIENITNTVLKTCKKVKTPFNQLNDAKKNLYIVVSSTLGLCGSYNSNIFKLADVSIKEEDSAIILGNKGIIHYENSDFEKNEHFEDSALSVEKLTSLISSFVISEYLKGTYHEIHLIYSEYKNSLVFIPRDFKILPLAQVETDDIAFGPILEPSPSILVERLIPIYIKTIINSKLLESEVCEQAARSNAMENATNNAQEILDSLQIEFNKARQGAITQEIVEIVGAAEAL